MLLRYQYSSAVMGGSAMDNDEGKNLRKLIRLRYFLNSESSSYKSIEGQSLFLIYYFIRQGGWSGFVEAGSDHFDAFFCEGIWWGGG